jgi:hypothetical protein
MRRTAKTVALEGGATRCLDLVHAEPGDGLVI